MKAKLFGITAVVVLIALTAFAFAGSRSTMTLKAGDTVYACNCGEKCACQSLSRNPGKCTCGQDLVMATVTKVDAGTAALKAEKWEADRTFKTTGKYNCACPPACKCDTIGQNPGKCTCGKDMEKSI